MLLLEVRIKLGRVQKHFKYKTRHIAGCLITREHGDHARYARQFIDNGVINYMATGTQRVMDFESHRLYMIKTKRELRIGTWSILPFDIKYDANEPMAFLLQSALGYKVLYITDMRYLKYELNSITHMTLEVNYIYEQIQEDIRNDSVHSALVSRIIESYFNLEHAIEMLKASDLARLEEIHLVHLNSQNSNARYIKNEVQKVTGVPVYVGNL